LLALFACGPNSGQPEALPKKFTNSLGMEFALLLKRRVMGQVLQEQTEPDSDRLRQRRTLRSLAGPAARNLMSRKTVMPAWSSATLHSAGCPSRGCLMVSKNREYGISTLGQLA
jgi:hypothetical protein